MGRRSGTNWDLLVIGGGTAGIVGAKTAAGLGARVLLVEEERTGGDCLWTGCVPSKTLIHQAATIAARHGAAETDSPAVDRQARFEEAMGQVRAAIRTIAPIDSPEALERDGVTVVTGRARFVGPGQAIVGDQPVRFSQALIATGAAPIVPEWLGLADVLSFTSETVWDMQRLPERLVILGGGPIGCELGQSFARLGSSVTLVHGAGRLLPREDPDASRLVEEALRADGVELRSGIRATGLDGLSGSAGWAVVLDDGSRVPFDALLFALGRRPRTGRLGLEAVNVTLDDDGFISVDDQLRTSNPLIRAAGDVTRVSRYTHTAGMYGSVAASNAVLGLRRTIATQAVPRVTFTAPEVAAVGSPTWPEPRLSTGRVVTMAHRHVDRAVTQGATGGFTRLVVDPKGVVTGATVVGPHAGETLGELTVAVHHRLRLRDLAAVTHAYPTWNDGVWNAAVADVQRSLDSPWVRRGTRLLRLARTGWLTIRQARRR